MCTFESHSNITVHALTSVNAHVDVARFNHPKHMMSKIITTPIVLKGELKRFRREFWRELGLGSLP